MTDVELSYAESLVQQFSRNLLKFPDALTYLNQRGVDTELVEKGLIGFCPPYSEYSFPLLKGRITVPIRDVHGRVIAFAGRQYDPMAELTETAIWQALGYKPALAEQTIQKWRSGKWVNESFAKGRHLFWLDKAKDTARQSNYIVIVEGYFDAIVMANKFIDNVSAVCGTAFSEYHAALVSRFCEHVVLLLDGDAAGAKGAERSIPIITNAGLIPHVVTLPVGVDPDDFVLKYGGKQLKRVLDDVVDENKPTLNIKVTG